MNCAVKYAIPKVTQSRHFNCANLRNFQHTLDLIAQIILKVNSTCVRLLKPRIRRYMEVRCGDNKRYYAALTYHWVAARWAIVWTEVQWGYFFSGSSELRTSEKSPACFVVQQMKTCWHTKPNRVGSRFTTGLRSPIFGCKSNRRKTSTV
jgi:hypothetical protein